MIFLVKCNIIFFSVSIYFCIHTIFVCFKNKHAINFACIKFQEWLFLWTLNSDCKIFLIPPLICFHIVVPGVMNNLGLNKTPIRLMSLTLVPPEPYTFRMSSSSSSTMSQRPPSINLSCLLSFNQICPELPSIWHPRLSRYGPDTGMIIDSISETRSEN